jgi:hypothetical protein
MNAKIRRWAPALAAMAMLTSTGLAAGCGASAASTDATGSGTAASSTSVTSEATSAASQATSSAASSSAVWNSCPKGITNDPYPGECSRYVDSNSDGICDLSQSDPTASSDTLTLTLALATGTDDLSTGSCPLGPCVLCGICGSLV